MIDKVIAPKDPTEKGNYFYLLKDTDIEATLRGNGVCSQETYLDNGRIVELARYSGEVTGEKILSRIAKTAGFRELVKEIGVSVVTKDPAEKVIFRLTNYGKKDTYGGGTTLEEVLEGNGQEHRIVLAKQRWSDDDDVVGMFAFLYGESGELASATVCLYLNDGFEAPKQSEEKEVDFERTGYKELLKKSVFNIGAGNRLRKAVKKCLSGEDITIGFIGGSITQGAGAKPISTKCYAYQTYEKLVSWLEELAPEDTGIRDRVHYVKAGIGGTSSELGMLRYDRDVCMDGKIHPDIVVIEFAVNDDADELEGGCYESLVRKCLYSADEPAVILLFSVFINDFNLQERLIPIGRQYELLMVSVKTALMEQFYDKEKRILSKRQYFYDMFHPSNMGHRVMADCLMMGMKACFEKGRESSCEPMEKENAVYTDFFEKVRLYDRDFLPQNCELLEGSFAERDRELQCVERNQNAFQTPTFAENWMKPVEVEAIPFSLRVKCRGFVIIGKDSGSPDVGTAEFYVDGIKKAEIDPHVNNWTHCNTRILLMDKSSAWHRIEVRMKQGEERKSFTILGFGMVE